MDRVHWSAAARLGIHARAIKEYLLGEREVALLRWLVPIGSTGIDVGAHKGTYTYWLSRLCSHVHAIEPVTSLANAIERARLKNVSVHNWAASSSAGTARFYQPMRDGRMVLSRSSLQQDANHGYALIEKLVETRPIDTLRLDDVGFMKIDVEGNELDTLRGAERTIGLSRPTLLVESETRHGDGPHAIESRLERIGYRGLFLLEGKIVPLERFDAAIYQSDSRTPYISNFIFVHSDRLGQLMHLLAPV